MGLSLSKIEDAILSLKEIIDYSKDKINERDLDILGKGLRSAVIHSFEYTYERTILTLRRWLDENYFRGKSAGTSKMEILKLSLREELIDDLEAWVEFGKARNLSSHTYNENNASYVYNVALTFLPRATYTLGKLKESND